MRTEKLIRPNPTTDTWSSRRAESFCKAGADPLGRASVRAQVARDSFGTKDIQDADTATHAWIAGQVGHHTLGAAGTLIWCWICEYFVLGWQWQIAGALGWLGIWILKERQDFIDTKRRKGDVFELDTSDVLWNVATAVYYIATGVLLVLAAFLGFLGNSFSIWLTSNLGFGLPSWLAPFVPLILVAFLLYLPTVRIAYWWLRRKLNFQQAGLPFFYRLANFKGTMKPDRRDSILRLANATNKKIKIFDVLFRPDEQAEPRPPGYHLVISGPIGAGKTSLAVGIGNEFALALQIGRYLTAVKLLQLIESTPNPSEEEKNPVMEKDGGRLLWPWRSCDLLVIDDVDEGANSEARWLANAMSFVAPQEFEIAIMQRTKDKGLPWLGERRSVWVVGDGSRIKEWRESIGRMLGIPEEELEKRVEAVVLSPLPDKSKSPAVPLHAGGAITKDAA